MTNGRETARLAFVISTAVPRSTTNAGTAESSLSATEDVVNTVIATTMREGTPYKDPEVLKDALLSGDFDLNPAKKEEA